jgi:transcription elongation factor Elf1
MNAMRYTAGLEVSTKIDIKPGELRCPRCFSKDVAVSAPRGFRDEFMAAWGRAPKHCRACGRRFYVRVRKAEEPDESLPTGPDPGNPDDPSSPPTGT